MPVVEGSQKSNSLILNGLPDRLGMEHFEPAVFISIRISGIGPHPNEELAPF